MPLEPNNCRKTGVGLPLHDICFARWEQNRSAVDLATWSKLLHGKRKLI